MKLYGGIDLHSNNSVFNLVDENANVVLKKRISNDIKAIIHLLEPYHDALEGLVVEIGTGQLMG